MTITMALTMTIKTTTKTQSQSERLSSGTLLALSSMLMIMALSAPIAWAQSEADEALDQFMIEYWNYRLQENPITATYSGVADFNHLLPQVSPIDHARRLRQEQALLAQLKKFNRLELNAENQVNLDLLQWVIGISVEGQLLNVSRVPFNTFSGFFTSALRSSFGVQMTTAEDYEAYFARLREFPRYFRENMDNMREGIRTGFVLPQIVIDGVLPTVRAQVYDNPEQSSLFDPLKSLSDSLTPQQQEQILTEGRQAINEFAIPAFRELADFLENEYYPASSTSIGVTELAGGDDYYAHQIRRYTTLTNLSADEIHTIGLSEVSRIRTEMDALIDNLEFDGSFEEFTNFLRTDPKFYATSKEQLLKEAAFVAKKIDYRMPEFFGRLPRLPYGVVPVPDEIAPNYTTASYNSAPIGGTRGGAYWVNTYALDQRPLYELTALTLHEAVPGHHQQNAIARELDNLPDFRQQLGFSAFGEGWGLYAEKLGIEMGVYETPYDDFGRLSYEMWRACRLVIDTGIHAKGWSRDRALAYLSDNTSLSEANVRAEVDRYISWPAQALAYKLGEMKILELREKTETALGVEFDIREFHDAVLGNGALPLDALEASIDRFIASQLTK
ncbi:MAG: hypothetical protein ACI8V0_001924 [Pseudohongiellaceae bacterium]|jgi:uncharacterized protein (DUF885 family)